MHVKSLKIFCDVVERRSFSRAADENGMSQSSASQLVQALERRLGVQLLDRSTRPFGLTPEGERFYDGCRDLVRRFAEGLLLATRSGVDSQRALDVMESSPIGSPMLRARSSLILDPPKDDAWFDLAFMRKDIELALDAGKQLDIPLPTAGRADEVLERAGALGYDRRDLAALYEVLQQA